MSLVLFLFCSLLSFLFCYVSSVLFFIFHSFSFSLVVFTDNQCTYRKLLFFHFLFCHFWNRFLQGPCSTPTVHWWLCTLTTELQLLKMSSRGGTSSSSGGDRGDRRRSENGKLIYRTPFGGIFTATDLDVESTGLEGPQASKAAGPSGLLDWQIFHNLEVRLVWLAEFSFWQR